MTNLPLEDFRVPTKLKLGALWAATMACYIYGDYFALYRPGRVESMNKGMLGPLGRATPEVLLGVSVMMAVPSLMIALSLLLPPRVSRWANIVLGVAYTVIVLLTMQGAQPFYLMFGTVDAALTIAITWVALRWPRATPG